MNSLHPKSKMLRPVGFAVVMSALVLSAPSARAEDNALFRNSVSFTGGLSVGSPAYGGFAGDFAHRFGFGRDGSNTGFAVGGTFARDVTPRLTVEASGLYRDQNSGGWSADAGLRLNLVPASRSMVPYFAVSGGLIGGHARGLDLEGMGPNDADLMGFLQSHIPNSGMPGRIEDAMAALRGAMQQQGFNLGGGRSYTDGMLTMGGGVRFDAGPHVFVRPDARAQLVFSNNARVLGLFTLNFGYRF
jgi:hypothetical protein